MVKWESTRYKPYTWCTILDILSAPVIGHKALADKIARILRDRIKIAFQQASHSTLSAVPQQFQFQNQQQFCQQSPDDHEQSTCSIIGESTQHKVYVNYKVGAEASRLEMNFINMSLEAKEELQKIPFHKLELVMKKILEDQFTKLELLTFESLFEKIMEHTCYLNYTLLRNIVDTFLKDRPLNAQFKNYAEEVNSFMDSTTLGSLTEQVIRQIDNSNITVELKLNAQWDKVTVKAFKHLLKVLFEAKYLTHMTVTKGCLCITWISTVADESIIATEWAYDIEFIKAIGVLYLRVGDTVIYKALVQEQKGTIITMNRALLMTIESGPLSAVELLLAVGGNPNLVLPSGRTIISKAATATDDDGDTVLHYACQWGHHNIAALLINANANPNQPKHNGWTPLMMAAFYKHNKIIELLVAAKVDVNTQTTSGITALYIACQYKHYETVLTLLDAKADPSIALSDGWTALMAASRNGHDDIAELLVNTKIDVNAQNIYGGTALYIASQNGHLNTLCILLNANADPSIAKGDGWTPLMVACKYGYDNIVELLINAKVDVNAQNKKGVTALDIASQNRHMETALKLLKADATKLNDGSTPLIIASQKGHKNIVELLIINTQADINVQRNDGATALYVASQNGHSDIVLMLLNANADPYLATSDSRTPLMVAEQNGYNEIVGHLLQ